MMYSGSRTSSTKEKHLELDIKSGLMIMTLYDKSLIRPTQLVHTQLEKKEWEVRGSSGDISLTDIYGKTF